MENQACHLDRAKETPQPHDVLCTRTKGATVHKGNRSFRFLVEKHQVAYNITDSKKEKNMIAKSIIAEVHSLSPPGRFLVKNGEGSSDWVEADEKTALNKVTRALREGGTKIREKAASQVLEQPTATVDLNAKQLKMEAERVMSSIDSSFQEEKTPIGERFDPSYARFHQLKDGGINNTSITENITWNTSTQVAETHTTPALTNLEQDSSETSSLSIGNSDTKEVQCGIATSTSRHNKSEEYKSASASTRRPSRELKVGKAKNSIFNTTYSVPGKVFQTEENFQQRVSPDDQLDNFDVSSLKIENNDLNARKVKASTPKCHQNSEDETFVSTSTTSGNAKHYIHESTDNEGSMLKCVENSYGDKSASSARSSNESPFASEMAQSTTAVVHPENRSLRSQNITRGDERGKKRSEVAIPNFSKASSDTAVESGGACDSSAAAQSDHSDDNFESPEFFRKLERAVDSLPDWSSQIPVESSLGVKDEETTDIFQQLEKAVENLPDWTGETAHSASAGGMSGTTEDTTESYQPPKRRILDRREESNSAEGSTSIYSWVPYIPEQVQPVMEFFSPMGFVVFGFFRGHSQADLLFFSFLFAIHTIVISLTVFGPNTSAYRLRWAFITPKGHACFDFAMNVSYCVVIHTWPKHFGIADDIKGVSRFVAIIAFMTVLNIVLSYTTIQHYALIRQKKLI